MKTLLLNKYAKTLLLLLVVLSLSSCYKDRFDLNKLEKNGEWSADVAAPAVYSSLTIRDLLDDYDQNNLVVEDATNFLNLIYWKKVYSKNAEDLLGIPNQTLNTTYTFDVVGTLPFGVDLVAPPNTTYYSFTTPNNMTIDNVTLKSGSFDFMINIAGFTHNATINIVIPSATKAGIPLNQNIDIFGSATTTQHIDLSGYTIVFDNTGGNQNRLAIVYTVTVHGQGGANNSPYTVNMGESFTNLKFEEIHGDFKQLSFNFPGDSIQLRLFTNKIHGSMELEDPKIHVYINSSFGLPIEINITNVNASAGWNAPYQLPVNGIPIPLNINPALSVGDSALTTYNFDKTNSNFMNVIAIAPQWVTTDISGLSNPSGAPASNFATAASHFDVNMQVELPLFGRAWDFVLEDTTKFDFGTDIDRAEYLEFRINTQNGFPIDAITQLYFLDNANHVIDSILPQDEQIISGALSGGAPDYRVYESVHKLTQIVFEKSRLTALKNTKKVIIRGRLATSQNGTQIVKIYSDYALEVRLAVRAKFNVQY